VRDTSSFLRERRYLNGPKICEFLSLGCLYRFYFLSAEVAMNDFLECCYFENKNLFYDRAAKHFWQLLTGRYTGSVTGGIAESWFHVPLIDGGLNVCPAKLKTIS
jgi:hypothetical protein